METAIHVKSEPRGKFQSLVVRESERIVKLCYIDEAGCCGALPDAKSNIQPTLVIGGVIFDYTALHLATQSLITLKRSLFPGHIGAGTTRLGSILSEIKGSELRKSASEGGRNKRRHIFRYLDGILNICTEANARTIGRVWIKGIGRDFDGRAVYTSSIQAIATYFQDYLTKEDDLGMMVVDSRIKALNSQVAHSIFTQKFKGRGDSYNRIIELPSFGHSDNHAGLQIADTICSALMTPVAVHSYCVGDVESVHVRAGYEFLKGRYAARIAATQHRYQEANGRWQGGWVVSDDIRGRRGSELFKVHDAAAEKVLKELDLA